MNNFFDFRLRNAPFTFKFLIAGFLSALSLAYLYAIMNIAIVVGLTPRDIAVHYYGADEVIRVEKETQAPVEETLDLDAMEADPAKKELGPRPSFKNLVAAGHFHLFGMTSFFFGLTILGLFTSIPGKLKTFIVGVPYFAIVMDNLSFMATRFLGPHFAYLTAISGAFMGLCFTALWFSILLEIFKKPEVQ